MIIVIIMFSPAIIVIGARRQRGADEVRGHYIHDIMEYIISIYTPLYIMEHLRAYHII